MRSPAYTVATIAATAALVSAQVTGELGDAEIIGSNPAGATYVATLPDRADTTLRGTIRASSGEDGVGVNFELDITGLPVESSGGEPFSYHLHVDPVPADGNCTATLAHLDPTIRGEDPPCDPSLPQTCQVGDLSGKHGKIDGPDYATQYLDKYAALAPGIGAFFGNRSIVLHYANKTRISCANFALVDAGETNYTATSTITVVDTVTTVCPTDTPYCYNNGNSTTFVPFGTTGLTPSGGATALPTGDGADGGDDLDDGDDFDGGDDGDDGDDAFATETSTGAPVVSTAGATAGVWMSTSAVLAALAALVL